MVWNIFDAKWEKAYALAAAYYEENGNLNIPRSYVTAAGERLGQWVASQQWAYPKGKLTDEQVKRQRYTHHNPEKSCAVLTEERIAKLDAIGMRWEKADSRLRRLDLALESKRKSENLNVSANHKTGEEISLCS